MTSGSKPERTMELENDGNSKSKNDLDTKTNKYKGSEGEECLVYLRNSRGLRACGASWVMCKEAGFSFE